MYEAPYKNHFLHIRASRATFLSFARYTHGALLKTDNAALKAQAAAFGKLLAALGEDVTERGSQGGTALARTRGTKEVTASIREWARETHDVTLKPKFRKRPAELKALLPLGLSGITKADAAELPIRLEVLLRELESRQAEIGAADATAGRALLTELQAARQQQDSGQKEAADTIGDLGESWVDLCGGLWLVHCTALAQFHDAPHHARAFFNYDELPDSNAKRAANRAGKEQDA
ncbi:hypothetical protein EJV47_19360 [Hymenobacter gummosus]|uniref:Uncharacterized protein n=1 Tax=Hymenobacter gummosus TaxID=1776032 RepID=A0A3S0K3D6_9BACT|nr:hypothetical protein [Hymenobacter gummosus]RTQ47575.1 hypothetical protein EJV47_19360 [Hymenobacter gummosus]